ncbi:beta-1,4-galactosyltransferase 4-like [Mizuhopecten yessoensis]|uniref:beta-1,4-galactosyltransferase 4-like n=1 Tax=Mizuhopecten yessoensis TaxID=6573 RepID=UPI000B45E2FE|nr:beta-1,4-galactosyltransferase 4-like [Mizuhopecten yessoensis]
MNKTFAEKQGNITELDKRYRVKAPIDDANNTITNIRRSIIAFDESYHKKTTSDDTNKTFTENQRIITESQLPTCVSYRTAFHGRETVNLTNHKWQNLDSRFNDTLQGGRWKPEGCKAVFRVAIIIPYRDRDSHLKILMSNLLPKLQRQQLDYTIFVVEQAPGNRFNRGMLRNIGFLEANKTAQYDCFIFNDVDTIIEDDRNMFKCDIRGEKMIRHIAVLVNVFQYKLLYSYLIGGILSVTYKQFVAVNGYSNAFFVWGGEDDDLFRRFDKKDYRVSRPSNKVAYTTTLDHERDPELDERNNVYKSVKNISEKDGMNTIEDKYKVVIREERKLFTWLYVRVDEELVQKSLDAIPKFKLPQTQPGGMQQAIPVEGIKRKDHVRQRHIHKPVLS